MAWNYRLCRETHYAGTDREEISLTFREVYYDELGKIIAHSENPVSIYGETVDDIKFALEKMQESLNKDIVDIDNLFGDRSSMDRMVVSEAIDASSILAGPANNNR